MVLKQPGMVSLAALLAVLVIASLTSLPFRAQGVVVMPINALWRYTTNNLQFTNWMAPGYIDSTWASGAALLYIESATLPAAKNTPLPPRSGGTQPMPTYYFRSTFTITNQALMTSLSFAGLIDDGGVFYLNGNEIQRLRMDVGAVSYTQLATNQPPGPGGDATAYETFFLSGDSLTNVVEGVNYLAFEVHQNSTNSSDVVFGCEVSATYGSSTVNLIRGPYLQLSSTTNITVCWRTDVPAHSRVLYGTNSSALTLTNDSLVLETDHFVTLTGLQPDTKYYYAVGTPETLLAGPGSSFYFLTHPHPGTEKAIRVWVIGDAGTTPKGETFATWQRAVRDAFVDFNGTNLVHAWLQLGDNDQTVGSDAGYQAAVFDAYPGQLRNTVTWPALGNHDTDQSTEFVDTYPYFSVFHLPRAGEAGGVASGTEHFYSFDLGMVHFICLDSITASRASNGSMANWLRADLAANTNRWTVAYFHYPPYSKGGYDSDDKDYMIEMRENFVPILEAGGVDLVLAGHSHVYERSFLINGHHGMSGTFNSNTMVIQPGSGRETNTVSAYLKPDGLGEKPVGHRGTVYMVVGCSGHTSPEGLLNHPAMYNSQRELGSMILDFATNRLDATFLPTNGVPTDWFTVIKEGTHPPTLTNATVAISGTFQFTVRSRAFRTNIVETADALATPVTWTAVTTNVSPTATFNYADTNTAGSVERYYRVRRR